MGNQHLDQSSSRIRTEAIIHEKPNISYVTAVLSFRREDQGRQYLHLTIIWVVKHLFLVKYEFKNLISKKKYIYSTTSLPPVERKYNSKALDGLAQWSTVRLALLPFRVRSSMCMPVSFAVTYMLTELAGCSVGRGD
jgi:hypothetical protein